MKKDTQVQRRAARAMKDAMHIGVDPYDANATFGLVYDKPFAVPEIKRIERDVARDRKAKMKRQRIYSRLHAIELWEAFTKGGEGDATE